MKQNTGSKKTTLWGVFLLAAAVPCFPQTGYGYESNQPYIDELKRDLDSKKKEEEAQESQESRELKHRGDGNYLDPYIQEIKRQLQKSDESDGYIDQLKKDNPALSSPTGDEGYTAKELKKLEPKKEGGAIQAVLDGKSELKPKIEGAIHNMIGFRYGAIVKKNYTADPALIAQDFNSVYGQNYSPNISGFYEYQPFHSETFGNFGVALMGGLDYNSGVGRFAFPVPKPPVAEGKFFPVQSSTKFQFFTLPLALGIDYRMNILNYVRPYVFIGPAAVGYLELRQDKGKNYANVSFGLQFAAGAAIYIPGAAEAFDLYKQHGIKRFYITLDYQQINTFVGAGPLVINISEFLAGFAYEY